MAEAYGDGGVPAELTTSCSNGRAEAAAPPLTVSASFKEGRSGSRRRTSVRPSFDADNEFMTLLHGSDPVKVELNRLENEVRGAEADGSSGFRVDSRVDLACFRVLEFHLLRFSLCAFACVA